MTKRLTYEQIVTFLESDLQGAFLRSIQGVVDAVVLTELIAAVEANDAQRVYEILGMNAAALRPLTAAIERAYEQSGEWTTEGYPRVPGFPMFRFDVRNPRAEEWLRTESSRLVMQIGEDTRNNVRETLRTGMERGTNPRQTALNIIGRVDQATGERVGGVVGLSQAQEGWVRSARIYLEQRNERYFTMGLRDKRFDATVRAAFDAAKPLPVEVIDKLVTRYKSSALRHRGEMIGRTESLAAFNAAELESARQVVASGAVRDGGVKREWDSAGDSRVRPAHRVMDGQVVGVEEPFVAPSGARLMHPGDASLGAPTSLVIACRCRVKTKIDWLGVGD